MATKARINLVFDLNGTLTSMSKHRKTRGSRVRTSCKHLDRLAATGKFRMHLWSSAMEHNVMKMRAQVEATVNFHFDRVLHRQHTIPQSEEKRTKRWDTCKPLEQHFGALDRVLLVDDSQEKVLPNEMGNLILIPTWDEDRPPDATLEVLVDALLELAHQEPDDVREHTASVQAKVWSYFNALPEPEPSEPSEGGDGSKGKGGGTGNDGRKIKTKLNKKGRKRELERQAGLRQGNYLPDAAAAQHLASMNRSGPRGDGFQMPGLKRVCSDGDAPASSEGSGRGAGMPTYVSPYHRPSTHHMRSHQHHYHHLATTRSGHVLPVGWAARRDPSSGVEYYYNMAANITQWEMPRRRARDAARPRDRHGRGYGSRAPLFTFAPQPHQFR